MKKAWLIGIPLLLVGCSYLLIAKKSDKLIFSHKAHLGRDVECLTCHQKVEESTDVRESHLPPMETCSTCHEEETKAKCAKCHTVPDEPAKVTRPVTRLHFSHKSHMERVKGDCRACHARIAKSRSTGKRRLPTMDDCLSCHRKDYGALKCLACHEDMTDYELKPITQFSHQGDFLKNHKEYAQADVSLCAQCHQQSFCADCHSKLEELKPSLKYPERLDRAFIHRGDWITVHRIEAESDSTLCLRCHDGKSCSDCHQKSGIGKAAPGAPNPHPAGWLDRGSGSFHGKVARREAALCASCHEQGSNTNCIACHRTGKNIHPPGWKSTLDKHRDPLCRNCHQ